MTRCKLSFTAEEFRLRPKHSPHPSSPWVRDGKSTWTDEDTRETPLPRPSVSRARRRIDWEPPPPLLQRISFADCAASTSLDSRSHPRRRSAPRLLGVTGSKETRSHYRGRAATLVQAAVGFDLHR